MNTENAASLQAPPIDAAELRKYGIYTATTLAEVAKVQRKWCVTDLLMSGSVNLLVGDSGLGKTPLVVQLGICVASGVDFLGHRVQQGRVLHFDFESPSVAFDQMQNSISTYLGFEGVPPEFLVRSTDWEHAEGNLFDQVRRVQPKLVVVDPLRLAFPALSSNDSGPCVRAFSEMRQLGCTWLAVHHRRKESKKHPTVPLLEGPQEWLQESAGSFALVNHSDTRLGVARSKKADVDLAGFVRGCGPTTPVHLRRVMDEVGNPIGYDRAQGVDLLSPKHQELYANLPLHFHFKDVLEQLSNSGSGANAFVKSCIEFGIAAFRTPGMPRDGYVKCCGVNGVSGANEGRGH